MSIRAFMAFCLCLALQAAGTEKPLIPAKDMAELRTRIQTILKDQRVPGISMTILERDGSLRAEGLGMADRATNKVATPETLFRIGSISKLFAALAALQLVEEGRLDLNTPVHQLVPDVTFTNPWEATDPVRVVHLLEHTTGWEDIHFKELAHNDPTPITLQAALTLGPEARTSRWRPGTRFAYCNSGPAVFAAIVERLTGQAFEQYIQTRFFQPIGMTTATYFQPSKDMPLATLYHGDGATPFPYWHISLRPAGSINASARDMGAFLRFFLSRGRVGESPLLTEASILRMERPVSSWGAQAGLKTGYGLCNYTSQDDRGFLWHGHTGGLEGGLASLSYLPENGVGCFFAINVSNGVAFEKIDRELRAYAARDLSAPTLPPSHHISSSIESVEEGWYSPISPRNQALAFTDPLGMVHFQFDPIGVVLKPLLGAAVPLVAVDDTHFRRAKESVASIVFTPTPEGRMIILEGQTLKKITPLRAWTTILLALAFVLAFLSVPLFALVWGTRWTFRRMKQVPCLQVRVLPLLAWLCLITILVDLMLSSDEVLLRFGHRTAWSMTLTAGTLGFGLLSLASLIAGIRARSQPIHRGTYWHSLIVAIVFSLATLYLAWHGFIGYRSWV